MKLLATLSLLILVGCKCGHDTNKKVVTNSKSEVAQTQINAISKDNLLGIWTDGSTENATFDIKRDSIFYVDPLNTFKYNLKDDSITITYSDWVFSGQVSFTKDTLVISSEEGQTKYWKFEQ